VSHRTTIERHEPERGGSRGSAAAPAGCCCCCCLHSIGGVIGGVIGTLRSLNPSRPAPFDDDAPPFQRGAFEEPNLPLPVPLVYWLLVLCLGAVWATLVYFSNGPGSPQALIGGWFAAVLILPMLQLGASVLTAILVRLFWGDQSIPLRRVGWITLYSVVGALAGLGIMCGGCVLLGGMR
jgi:hypothetical protein